MLAKRKLKKQFGTSRVLLASYFDEYIWRRRHSGTPYFSAMMACITDSYPL